MPSYSALVLAISAPSKITPGKSIVDVEFTGFGVIGTDPRWTEHGPKRRALPRTAGSPAASRHLGVARVAAGDIARVVGEGESTIKEIYR